MHRRKNTPSQKAVKVNTSALPDIIFMLLFFFMVVTVLRNDELLLDIQLPKATELDKLQHKSLINYLYIGQPRNPELGNTALVQINDAFVPTEQLEATMKQLMTRYPEPLQARVINSLKIDQDAKMGIVDDVKVALRKAQLYKVSYAAVPRLE